MRSRRAWPGYKPQEVRQQQMAVLGQYRFGMKLQAVCSMLAVGEGHDLPLLGARRHREMWRATIVQLDNERMVAADAKWRGKSIEQSSTVMRDG
ncbi:hypothetical protein ABIC10_007200 [Bradyrhizobium sp. S3.2.12]